MLKKRTLISAVIISMLQFSAYAGDITITNNTDSPGVGYLTGKYTSSPCSSKAGSGGIAEPHASITLPDYVLSLIYCRDAACKGHIYMARNCNGSEVATVIVDAKKGVTDIVNNNVDGYKVTGSGFNITVEGGSIKKWYQFLF